MSILRRPDARAATWLVAALCLGLQLLALDRYPAPWFDEGFRFNAGRLMGDTGQFGSRSVSGVIPFDVGLTSGPLEVSLVAVSFKLFGLGVFTGRLPFVLLLVISLLLIARIGRQVAGDLAGLFTLLVVIAVPSIGEIGVLLFGRQALSETPALTMVLIGINVLIASWRRGSTPLAVLAGVACGIGVLSKSQFALALAPALAVVGAARLWSRDDTPPRAAAPLAGLVAVVAAWWFAGFLAVDAAVRQSNSAFLGQGIQANILTGLWGRTLDHHAMLVAGLCMASAAWGAWRVAAAWRTRTVDAGTWTVALLSLVITFNTVWFTLFSIGWPRYAYLGWVAALILAGIAVGEWVTRAHQRGVGTGRRAWWPAVAGAMAVVATVVSVRPIVEGSGNTAATEMSRYLDDHVRRDAVIETWEWELSGLGQHTAFHFPSQRFVYESTYQQGRHLPFDLRYDPMPADPDYLVVGPFGTLTGIYPASLIAAHFDAQQTIGSYVLYARRRGATASLTAADGPRR